MAKTGMIERNNKRRRLAARDAEKRSDLKTSRTTKTCRWRSGLQQGLSLRNCRATDRQRASATAARLRAVRAPFTGS